jgi:hypothetical protein
MEKLRKIIKELNDRDFDQVKSALIKNDSQKFLNLFASYHDGNVSDEKIRKSVLCSENSFYVLKSRLLEKIRGILVENNHVAESNPLIQYIYEYPRESAIAILQQLERTYIEKDVPQELINVYSALKKTHYHTDKYYHYSQLYNKQIAYTIAFEKAEELLFNFNKALADYYFSRSDNDKELILFCKREIKNIYSLNQSHRFELVYNFILIQCQLFTNIEQADDEPVEDLIKKCEQIITNYPKDKLSKYCKLIVGFFWLEYYYKISQFKKAEQYLWVIDAESKTWLLYNNYCLSFKYLLTKPQLLCKLNKIEKLGEETQEMYFDNYDFYTLSMMKFRKSFIGIYSGDVTESIHLLKDLINGITLHHFFHFELEIKLTLSYLYIKQKKGSIAKELIASLTRKVSADKNKDLYQNALVFIEVLNLLLDKERNATKKTKLTNAIQQFNYCNTGERKLLAFLQPEIDLILKNF